MLDLERTQREKKFHDNYFDATEIRKSQSRFYSSLVQDALLKRALAMVDCVRGAVILHLGCGSNLQMPSRFLEKGATRVFSTDLSSIACRVVRDGLRKRGDTSWKYVAVMNAEQLGFASDSFDLVFGRAIVHHLDLNAIAEELFRILKPGGQAVLIEPLGMNPLINYYRCRTPEARTVDEHALVASDLRKLGDRFGGMRTHYFFLTQLVPIVLLSRIQGGALYRMCFGLFGALDRCLYAALPFLRKYSWCVVFCVVKTHVNRE
jgi:SAM-dependent methyltransferase